MRDFKGQEIGRLVQIRDSFVYDTEHWCVSVMTPYLGTIQEVKERFDEQQYITCNDMGWFWPSKMLIAVA